MYLLYSQKEMHVMRRIVMKAKVVIMKIILKSTVTEWLQKYFPFSKPNSSSNPAL